MFEFWCITLSLYLCKGLATFKTVAEGGEERKVMMKGKGAGLAKLCITQNWKGAHTDMTEISMFTIKCLRGRLAFCISSALYLCVCATVCVCLSVSVCVCVCACVCPCMCVHANTCIHTHYTHTHTHTSTHGLECQLSFVLDVLFMGHIAWSNLWGHSWTVLLLANFIFDWLVWVLPHNQTKTESWIAASFLFRDFQVQFEAMEATWNSIPKRSADWAIPTGQARKTCLP